MNNEQALQELRKEFQDERLQGLIRQVTKAMADQELRLCYTTNESALLIRQTGVAEGMERLVREITKPPVRAKGTTADQGD